MKHELVPWFEQIYFFKVKKSIFIEKKQREIVMLVSKFNLP